MDNPLAGKVVVITGGSHGLGQVLGSVLAALGADIVLIARDMERLHAAASGLSQYGTRVLPLSCDIGDQAQVEQAAKQIQEQMGRVDVLVNNAGIPAPRTIADTTFADWERVIDTNLSGAFYVTRALWDALTASGAGYVITISGVAGVRGGGSPAYGAAKFGLTGFNHAVAAAGKEKGVRATVLYLGGMDTGWRGAPIGEKPRADSMDPEEVARFIAHLIRTPHEFVVNEAVINPINTPLL